MKSESKSERDLATQRERESERVSEKRKRTYIYMCDAVDDISIRLPISQHTDCRCPRPYMQCTLCMLMFFALVERDRKLFCLFFCLVVVYIKDPQSAF